MTQHVESAPLSWWEMGPQAVREKINQRIMEIDAPVPVVWSVAEHTVQNHDRKTPIRLSIRQA